MSDNLPGRSYREGAGKPLGKREWARRNQERRALELWIETQSYVKVKNELGLRSADVARELVTRGEARWEQEEKGALTRHIAAQVSRMYEIIQASREGALAEGPDGEPVRVVDWAAVDREMKAWDRLSRLLGLDKQRDDQGGPQFVIEVRRPDERGEVIEGEIVQNELEPPKGP